jgi:hypothetical protein
VGQHLFLNIIPSNFIVGTGREVWCDRGMRVEYAARVSFSPYYVSNCYTRDTWRSILSSVAISFSIFTDVSLARLASKRASSSQKSLLVTCLVIRLSIQPQLYAEEEEEEKEEEEQAPATIDPQCLFADRFCGACRCLKLW